MSFLSMTRVFPCVPSRNKQKRAQVYAPTLCAVCTRSCALSEATIPNPSCAYLRRIKKNGRESKPSSILQHFSLRGENINQCIQ